MEKSKAPPAEQTLRGSEERYRRLIDNTGTGFVVVDDQGVVLLANEPYLRLAGARSVEDVVGHSVIDWTAPDERENNARAVALCARQGSVTDFETVYQHGDGTRVHVIVNALVQESADGQAQITSFVRDITDRWQAEEALRKFDRLFQGNPVPMAVNTVPDARFTDFNDAFLRMQGYSREEVIGRTAAELGLFAEPEQEREMARQLRTYGRVSDLELKTRRKDGTVLDSLFSAELLDGRGQQYSFSTVIDQTEHKRADAILQEQRWRLESIIEGARAGTWEWNVQTGETVFNEQWAQHAGYTLAELSPVSIKTWEGITHPDDLKRVGDLLERHFAGELPYYECDSRMKHKDGRWIWVRDRGRVITHTEDGKPLMMFGTHSDINENKLAEQALRGSEKRFRDLFDLATDGILVVSLDGDAIALNDSFARMHGYSVREMLQMRLADWNTPESAQDIPDRMARLLRGETLIFESDHLHKDGHIFPVEISSSLISVEGRSVVQAFHRDITERRRAEQAEREGKEQLDAVFNNNLDQQLLLSVESDGVFRVRRINATNIDTLKHIGFDVSEADLSGMAIEELITVVLGMSSEHMASTMAHLRQASSSCHVVTYEDEVILYDVPYCAEVTIVPILDSGGVCVYVLYSAHNMTERRAAEEVLKLTEAQLHQAQKMESVGRLAGGVAHDFNNMLAVILGHTEMALAKVDPTQALHSHLTEIQDAGKRSADLTRQLLAFARKQTIVPRVVDLNETIGGMVKLLQRLVGENIALTWLPGAELWPVKVDPSQVDQLLANLCVNARDAIDGVGRLTIETGNSTFDEAYAAVHPDAAPGGYVRITVSDDGCGMDEETVSHLFEPFFTTKKLGQGTGLGLATVYGVVKQSEGFVEVSSKPGEGSAFTIYLPRYLGDAQQSGTEDSTDAVQRGAETILLVEDEPATLRMTKAMLEDQGYTVIAARAPTEAFGLAEGRGGRIDLLMTDVIMPDMNGKDLATDLLSLYPHLRCLLMSGYPADVIGHSGALDEGVHFIKKPFSQSELADKVREALGDR